MKDNNGLPVLTGLGTGIAFIISFILFSPLLPDDVTAREVATVVIPDGASLESNPDFFVPKVIKVMIGVNNTVRWVSQDEVPHDIASNTDYRDPYSGRFNTYASADLLGGFIMPGETYEFTFTKPGEYPYHGEPHPWMQGTVIVLPP